MKSLLKIIFILAAFFASTFLIFRFSGLLTVDEVTAWLEEAKRIDEAYLFLIVVLLLFCDLFIAVPTLTITVFSGYFLGFATGGLSAATGMLLAGLAGYGLSRKFGEHFLKRVIKSESQIEEAKTGFNRYGTAMILLSRASPILPEVSACMAGMTGMNFYRFFLVWGLNTIPYSLIAAYSGSISSIENPKPAIYAAIGINAFLWFGWFMFKKIKENQE